MNTQPVPQKPGKIRRGLGWILRLFVTPTDSPSLEAGSREPASPSQTRVYEFESIENASTYVSHLKVVGMEAYQTGLTVVAVVPAHWERPVGIMLGVYDGKLVE